MAKNAVYSIGAAESISADTLLKRIALGFDTIYLDRPIIWWDKDDLTLLTLAPSYAGRVLADRELYDYLLDEKVIALIEYTALIETDTITGTQQKLLERSVSKIKESGKWHQQLKHTKSPRQLERVTAKVKTSLDVANDSLLRVRATEMARRTNQEFYPILMSEQSFEEEGTKTMVLRTVLKNLPQPDKNTPWEAIIDFRKDEETRLQYLALMNWINEMGRSDLTANEITEKLDYLVLEYKKSIERHRLKWKTGILEVVAAAGVGFFTGNLPIAVNLASNFAKMGTTVLNLREEEGKLPGKEIAYIYHSNKRFSKI